MLKIIVRMLLGQIYRLCSADLVVHDSPLLVADDLALITVWSNAARSEPSNDLVSYWNA